MKDRGAAQGLLGIAISLGSGLGPFVGGLFAQRVSWRWTFCEFPALEPAGIGALTSLGPMSGITPPMGAITMVIIWFLLPLNPVSGDLLSKVKRMDWLGTVLSLAMTVCLLVSTQRLSNGPPLMFSSCRYRSLAVGRHSSGNRPLSLLSSSFRRSRPRPSLSWRPDLQHYHYFRDGCECDICPACLSED